MKNSTKDPFDLNLCMRGFGNRLTTVHSDVYEYCYYLTFKRSMKMYASEFNDPDDAPVHDLGFFETTGDAYVTNCFQALKSLINCKLELINRFGIIEEDDLDDERLRLESDRYKPYFLRSKRSKSYKRLKLYYERLLVETIKCLSTYVCVLTAKSYKVPRVLKKQMLLPEPECYRLLNPDDNNVMLLQEIIVVLKNILLDFRRISAEHLLKTIAHRRPKKTANPCDDNRPVC